MGMQCLELLEYEGKYIQVANIATEHRSGMVNIQQESKVFHSAFWTDY
jgi:hypothetical protein